MIPIYTFTANLVAETTYYVDEWGAGKTSRASKERFQVGGKGINVSKMLRRLEAETTAVCFPGGVFGEYCQLQLEQEKIPYKGFTKGCTTRSGSVIRSPKDDEISILGLDCVVSSAAVHSCIDYLDSIHDAFVLAICGVIPDWNGSQWNPLREWVQRRDDRVTLALDTYGPGLEWLATQAPDVIKINRDELVSLCGKESKSEETTGILATIDSRYPCPRWVITDGHNPIQTKRPGHEIRAFQPRTAQCVSPIGCGDVFFATLLDGLYNHSNPDWEASLAQASEYATRNAESHGIADFELDPKSSR